MEHKKGKPPLHGVSKGPYKHCDAIQAGWSDEGLQPATVTDQTQVMFSSRAFGVLLVPGHEHS